ncbi:hypothetical protein E8E13_011153 [Curvularia kusanoi]|uniref:Rhodopsin domain-containing protein n=1 Tax=Curvularia kusanoi TaxID=90978 RepID=A0A9P4TI17_CURKU|nr:hypothetical protein E8E13_011153 [Curvularia kusanoi]
MPRLQLEGTNTAMLVMTSVIFLIRVVVRLFQRKPYELHDLFCHMAFVSYIVMWVMYYFENDPLYRAEAAQRGEMPPYPEILHDAGMIYRWITAGQMFFYASLTLVKISLLSLYRRLLDRMPYRYTVIWWVILVSCLLSFVGSSMTTIFVCDKQKAKYNQGICAKPNEQRRARFSLWFAYAVDVATDLAVMSLPFRLTWSLSLPRTQKVGIFVLFGSGWICILFATLRVVQVGVKNGVPSTPDPKWLQMWTIIETSMAVVICCAPAFAGIIRRRFGTPDVSYNSRGYVKRSTEAINIKAMKQDGNKRARRIDEMLWTEDQGSQEALADPGGLIAINATSVDDTELSIGPSTRS